MGVYGWKSVPDLLLSIPEHSGAGMLPPELALMKRTNFEV